MASAPMELPDSGTPSMVDATLHNTIGAAFVGVVVASILFGVSSLQSYLYFHHWGHDTIVNRLSVWILWFLDAFHLSLTCHAVYHYTITSFGQLPKLQNVIWSIKLQIAINVVIILIVQSLYAWRVWLLGGYHQGTLGYVVMGVVAGGFVIGTVLAYEIYTIHKFTELSQVAWAVDASLAASTTIDFVLAAAMCFYLGKSKGFESRLNSKISRVMQYTLSSGLFTSACSLSALFTYIFLPNTMIFFAIESLLTKLYVGSFLTMLNARERPTDRMDTEASNLSTSLPRFSRKGSRPSLKRSSSTRKFISIASPIDSPYFKSPRDSDGSTYSQQTKTSLPTMVVSSTSEYFTSLPSPDPVQLPRLRTGELSSQSPITPSRPTYMDQW